MDSFYLIIISLAVISLIVILTFLGIQMKNQKNKSIKFPSSTTTMCPDYWSTTNNEDEEKVCKVPPPNNKNVGTLYDNQDGITKLENTKSYDKDSNTINFYNKEWNDCDKKDWTTKNNIFWRGVNEFSEC
tara:strand:+ start:2977 stop:3366 length:390 start_codon:yes stop_codon:yes gene_type:complete